jgi:hypothetical protein
MRAVKGKDGTWFPTEVDGVTRIGRITKTATGYAAWSEVSGDLGEHPTLEAADEAVQDDAAVS